MLATMFLGYKLLKFLKFCNIIYVYTKTWALNQIKTKARVHVHWYKLVFDYMLRHPQSMLNTFDKKWQYEGMQKFTSFQNNFFFQIFISISQTQIWIYSYLLVIEVISTILFSNHVNIRWVVYQQHIKEIRFIQSANPNIHLCLYFTDRIIYLWFNFADTWQTSILKTCDKHFFWIHVTETWD